MTAAKNRNWQAIIFQLTRPLRGVTRTFKMEQRNPKFQLTRPLRGVTERTDGIQRDCEFQLTRPLRGVT